jgi:voltage-gated potassium channel
MKAATHQEIRESATVFQIFIIILSVYVLGALFVEAMFPLRPEMKNLLHDIDSFICLIFLGDFFHRFYRAPSKWRFLRWGWIDLLASIPTLDAFRSGNIFRIVRIFRILRAFRSLTILLEYLLKNRLQNTFATVAAISCLIVMGGSMAIFNLEKDNPSGNIKTASDAIWWSIVTITTVGYGDRYPVSDPGRIVAAFLMIAGVGLFGTFTGFVASMFVEPDIKREENEIKNLSREIRALREEVAAIDQKLTLQVQQPQREQESQATPSEHTPH